ncbi:hypothetical protein [Streptomyces populi]|uniref:hypothetical protein n=1 Tax=Streptomyces populi TaxID=2058924 RepID=UPI0013A709E2|nr:hypothetical protein [Streptomyces populi]
MSRNPDHLDVFWVRPDGGIGSSWWDAATRRWATPFSIAPARHALYGTLAAVARNPDQLDVFWIGPDRAIGTTAWNPSHGWLRPWPITQPGAAHYPGGALSVVSRTQDQLDLFWVRPDGGVSTAWWNARANWPSRSIAPAGHVLIGTREAPKRSALTAVARRPDQLDVFWIGPDGGIGTTAWNPRLDWPQPWPIAWPGAAAPGGLAATSRSPGQIDLVWITKNNRVQHLGFDERLPGGWDGLAVAPAEHALPGPIALVGRGPRHMDAFWVRPDRVIGTNWWNTERVRVHIKLVNLPGADMAPVTRALADARTVFGRAEVDIDLVSVERIDVPGMDVVDTTPCLAAPNDRLVSAEQNVLFGNRNNVADGEVVLYVAPKIENKNDAAAVGCASHPVGRPGAVMAYDATRWTMAHELGHVLDLEHVKCDIPPCNQFFGRLMWPSAGQINKDVPDITAEEKSIMYASSLTR